MGKNGNILIYWHIVYGRLKNSENERSLDVLMCVQQEMFRLEMDEHGMLLEWRKNELIPLRAAYF